MLRIGEVKTAQDTYDLKGVNCGWKNKYSPIFTKKHRASGIHVTSRYLASRINTRLHAETGSISFNILKLGFTFSGKWCIL